MLGFMSYSVNHHIMTKSPIKQIIHVVKECTKMYLNKFRGSIEGKKKRFWTKS
uniref:Uncharacterized protein n=1 Tax=Rhizophora mucronata TaxID=61149 RepID=A0A2P2NCJ6_RHIMU